MKRHWLILACLAAGAAPADRALFRSWASAAEPPVPAPSLLRADGPSTTPAEAEDFSDVPLQNDPFEAPSAGIAFRPPQGCKIVEKVSDKYLAEWDDPSHDWTLKLGKMVLDHPMPLLSGKDNNGDPLEGLLDRTVKNLKALLPGSQVLRQDVTNTRDGGAFDARHPEYRNNVGLIAIRYTNQLKTRLSQQAIIECPDGVCYLLTLTSPGSRATGDNAPVDPHERLAVDTFARVVDTVHLLDRKAIKKEQDDRLYNTRAAFVNWTPSKLRSVMVREQWVRVIKDRNDIGYSYITEDVAGAIPRPLTRDEIARGKTELDLAREHPGDGLLIGVRSRLIGQGIRADKTKGPIQTDSASWFFVSSDKHHEDFSRVVVTDDHRSAQKGYVQEFGVSEKRVRRYFERAAADPRAGVIQAPGEVVPRMTEDWELDVSATNNFGMAEPLKRKLPPWYIPQAFSYMLPRLLPLGKPQKFLFASYVSDVREVVMRYVDVKAEQDVTFAGQITRCVPIEDRLGLDGSVTTHYVTIDGRYLGSENREQKLILLPTNDVTLQHIWKDADLRHPDAVGKPGPANASSGTSNPIGQ